MLRKAMRRMELISCGYILHAYGIRLIAKAYGKISQRILDTYVVLEFVGSISHLKFRYSNTTIILFFSFHLPVVNLDSEAVQ